ncbi:MAG: homoserine O-succinyltransferase [Coriobacteriia bacterium]|nr:homoserine O-succinyltransferase [Coriobacteriia bacterium]
MPVNVPDGLPAIKILRQENIPLITEARAVSQDIRPLEIAIINLMPTKIATETQLLRLLANTPLQMRVTLVSMGGHVSRNTEPEHLKAFYIDSRELVKQRFDGLIVTGAPVETLPFAEVDYWDELSRLFAWSKTHVYRSMYICWGVNAALYYFYGIEKNLLKKKVSGVYPLGFADRSSRLLNGLDNPFWMPQSRFTTITPTEIATSGLKVLAGSDEAGAVILASSDHQQVFVTGHWEYDIDTLDKEYRRDLAAGLNPAIPVNYYPNDDPERPPIQRWKTYAHQFFANWLNYYVYQETPFDLSEL